MRDKKDFICECCHLTFDHGWSEEEAVKEKEELFGDLPLDDCARVCDTCFHKIMATVN